MPLIHYDYASLFMRISGAYSCNRLPLALVFRVGTESEDIFTRITMQFVSFAVANFEIIISRELISVS